MTGFRWLGITFDEGPYYQSQRFPLYQSYAQKLVEQGKAYHCYCTAADLEKERQEAWAVRRIWKYDRRCLNLPPEEKARRKTAGLRRTVRFLVPERTVAFDDAIHGRITRESREIEDFILLRADGSPTYNFAVVIDDALMTISHVIRGVEHITSTSKQILLYEAMGFPVPAFAHLPVILGRDRKKLSKRFGAASVDDFRREGYLPEALLNFLALLGWSPGGNREVLTVQEMINEFSLGRVNKADAVFDEEKLAWMNSEYLRNAESERLAELAGPFLTDLGIDPARVDAAQLHDAVGITKTRVRTLKELAQMMQPLVSDQYEIDPEAVRRFITPDTRAQLVQLADRFAAVTEFTDSALEATLRGLASELNVKAAALIHPCRVALTGKTVGPPLFDVVMTIGKERTLRRLRGGA